MSRGIAILWLLLACLLPQVGAAADGARMAIVATDFVLPEKSERLAAWGEPLGVEVLRWSPADAAAADWDTIDLLLLDVPRPSDARRVDAAIGDRLRAGGTPWFRVGGGPPAAGGLPAPVWRRFAGYYAGGGRDNYTHLLQAVARWRRREAILDLPPPRAMPRTGYYHPAAGAPFGEAGAYRAWMQAHGGGTRPRIGLIVSAGSVAGMQTAAVDAVAAALEARGLAPVPFWFEAGDPRGLQAALDGFEIEALVNMTHLQGGRARADELRALDVPVLQTMGTRMAPEDFASAESGIAQAMVAPFLTQPESWGLVDPIVISAVEEGREVPMPAQVGALADKLAALLRLRHAAPAERRLALMVWNYPGGERNFSASNLNVPRSILRVAAGLAGAGYDVPPLEEHALIADAQAMLAPFHRPETLDALLAGGRAALLPVARYRAWLDALPAARREALLAEWGTPEDAPEVRMVEGEPQFVVPRVAYGNLLLLPQPPRSRVVGADTHDTARMPDHAYLATYLWLREEGIHALLHFGTHGTQEWTPGKDRGLAADDVPWLAVGDLPVFYPYIQDNVGEAMQARRRGRATVISHQTPAFAPSGLYDELRDLHALVHEWMQAEPGPARGRTAQAIVDAAQAAHLDADIGWDAPGIEGDFDGFMAALHDHLHVLARSVVPLGLHEFGSPATPEHRLVTVMQQLGNDFYTAAGADPEEVLATESERLVDSAPYRLLERHLRDGAPLPGDPGLRGFLERARELDRHLAEPGEMEALLAALDGRFVPPGSGGDPVRNPDVPSGRNLYAFEADKLPTRAAYEAGGAALEDLLATYRAEHGGTQPRKLAVSLWSSEAMRHLGVLESQVLHAMGLRPRWDEGGRVVGLDIVPQAELGRPRIDVVVQVTSVYRDQFDAFMRMLAAAVDELAALDEAGNPIHRNVLAVAQTLEAGGMDRRAAHRLARLRLFGSAPGSYGSGLSAAVKDSTAWDEESALAEGFLDSQQYAFGTEDWGVTPADAGGSGNLLAQQLRGVEAALLSRSSNTHGLLSTDHPFEYLGGLSLAVRSLDGASPALYVADLRSSTPRTLGTARFLGEELRTRALNPQWIRAMQAEGYAGTLQVVDAVDNLFGWQVTDPASVRADQWQAMHDTFVRDTRGLDIDAWFEESNPAAQAQVVDRLLEAVRKEYWTADAQTLRELVARRQALDRMPGVPAAADATRAFAEAAARGFGLDAAASPPPPAAAGAATDAVRGQVLEEVGAAPAAPAPWPLALVALLALLAGGGVAQHRTNARSPPPTSLERSA
nr:cobaltochelatase subunit CobN [Coralloluteibacterium stylophorae]